MQFFTYTSLSPNIFWVILFSNTSSIYGLLKSAHQLSLCCKGRGKTIAFERLCTDEWEVERKHLNLKFALYPERLHYTPKDSPTVSRFVFFLPKTLLVYETQDNYIKLGEWYIAFGIVPCIVFLYRLVREQSGPPSSVWLTEWGPIC
jgi:hypothetical protein